MAIATLTIDIEARLANIERDLGRAAYLAEKNAKRMESAFDGVGESIRGAFAGIAAGISVQWMSELVTSALDAQDAISDLNKSTGISIDLLAGLKGASSSAGTDLEGVAAAVNKLSINMAKAPEKFAALGISAKDPLEALKQLADVFAAIEDPQQRAAVAAEAVGKSWASLAPLLSDGGKALGDVVEKFRATSGITEETARRAADLNDKLDILKSRASGAGTELVNLLVPSLMRTAEEMENAARKGNGLQAVLVGLAGIAKLPAQLYFGEIDQSKAGQIKSLQNELGELVAKSKKAKESGGGLINNLVFGKPDEIDNRIAVVKNQIDALQKYGKDKLAAPDDGEGKTAPTASAIKKFIGPDGSGKSGGGKTAKAVDDGARLVAQLQDQARAVQDLTAVERLESEIADGKYKKVSAANLEQARGLAATIDAMKKSREEAKSAQDAFMAMSSEAAALFVAVRTPAEELEARIARLNELLESGAISMETFGRAAQEAGKAFQLIKPALTEIDQFAVEAARNIQDAFAEFLFDPFKDGTEGMLKSFGDMIRRMIANAVAADLAKRLFGDFGKGEGVGGLLGDGLKWAAGLLKGALPSFDVGTDYVPRDMVAQIHKGERIVPAANNRPGALGGHSVSVVINMGGSGSPAEVRRAGGAAAREVLGVLQSARRYS